MTDDVPLSALVDEDALAAYLAGELGPVDGFEFERHRGGHSNETLFLTWGDRELVLRRPPPGETADTAHDVLREYRVMAALQETDVRVPTTVLGCDDHSVIGSDFYLMERLDGEVIRDEEPARFATPEARRAVGEELIDRLAEIHAVDYEAVGLGDFGRPEGYIDRQVDRWHRQFEWAFEVTAAEREVPDIATVGEWLDDNVPTTTEHTLVHGDYKLDNVQFAPGTPPEIAAVFDWELSTLGDPLFDLAWIITYWRDPDDPESALPELLPSFTVNEGYPTKTELVERYESLTGRTFEHARFYRVLAVYKVGALSEMFFRRHLDGSADDPLYPKMRDRVPALADWALRIIEGEDQV